MLSLLHSVEAKQPFHLWPQYQVSEIQVVILDGHEFVRLVIPVKLLDYIDRKGSGISVCQVEALFLKHFWRKKHKILVLVSVFGQELIFVEHLL